jgi:single-strand DNA-binding protein
METLVGRLVSDATVNTLKDERQVVNFSIAINHSYKTKHSDDQKKVVTYVNCSYWISTAIAKHLTKGSIVEISGWLYVRAYMSGNDPKASLNCHANHIKIHHFGKAAEKETAQAQTEEVAEDLPF